MARSAKPRKRKSQVRHSGTPRYVVQVYHYDSPDDEGTTLRFGCFDDAVCCCLELNIPFFADDGNKKLVFWFVRRNKQGMPETARCTEREFASLSAHITAGAIYCPECGTVHYPDENGHA